MPRRKPSPLVVLSWLAAGSGVSIPGLSVFAGLTPPLVPVLSVLMTYAAQALVLLDIYSETQSGRGGTKRRSRVIRSRRALGLAVAALCVYTLLLLMWTVTLVEAGALRVQIGFGLSSWGLTALGQKLLEENPLWTARELLLSAGAVAENLWQPWTIYTAGVLLIVTFVIAFTAWVRAFALLAVHMSAVERAQKREQ